jgi:phosphate transport system permease protein
VICKVVLPHAAPACRRRAARHRPRLRRDHRRADGQRPPAHAIPAACSIRRRTITATIAAELGEAAHGSDHYQVLFVLGLLLFLITFGINLLADRIVRGPPEARMSHHRPTFAATPPRTTRNHGVQQLVRMLFLAVTLLLVVPVLLILGCSSSKAPPACPGVPRRPAAQQRHARPAASAGADRHDLADGRVALLLALPLGVAAAIYLSEYARDNWLTRTINLAIVNLAGVPSIVHALFGVGAFVHFLHFGKSILAASCTLAVMTLPVVIVATRESLQAVPKAFREACWSMGATRWQTIWRVVLPNSGSGILTGLILVVCRAVGETAPIMFTGAAFFLRLLPPRACSTRRWRCRCTSTTSRPR